MLAEFGSVSSLDGRGGRRPDCAPRNCGLRRGGVSELGRRCGGCEPGKFHMNSLKGTWIVRVPGLLALALGVLAVSPTTAMAQLNGFKSRGCRPGAGTQAPPGPYYGMVFYRYGADTIKDRDGNKIAPGSGDTSLNMFAFVPLLNVVTKQKVLGANYGFVVAPRNREQQSRVPTVPSEPRRRPGRTVRSTGQSGLAPEKSRCPSGLWVLRANRTVHAWAPTTTPGSTCGARN